MKNKIFKEDIEALIDSSTKEEHIFHAKELVVSYKLENGFTVTGRGAVIDPKNFDLEIGRQVARESAISQMWQLEGYRLQLELHKAGLV